jgi:hypothetical protein
MIRIISLPLLALFLAATSLYAQVTPTVTPKNVDPRKVNLSNRANDHFLVQLGYDTWLNKPDSIKTKGFSRSMNVYFMFDFPFKTDSRFSIGLGAGVGTSTMYLDKQRVDIGVSRSTLFFPNLSDTNYYKKYKLVLTYLEAPVELRFVAHPENSNKSFKIAIGAKIGTLLSAGTKGKNLLSKTGAAINSNTVKEKNKQYFNTTRFSVMGRIGYGNISLFGQYQINNFLKDGAGLDMHPLSVGITFSGL